jgi:replication initiation protein RepC
VLLHLIPAYRDWVPSAPPSWNDIQLACKVVQSHLQIPPQIYGQACAAFGMNGAAVAIGTIAAKQAAGQVRNPAGYLRRMVERHRAGDLHLDRTLHGLAAAARQEGCQLAQQRPGSWTL